MPDEVLGREFTLLDVSWNAMRRLSLALAGLLGLALLGRHDLHLAASAG